VIRVFVSGWSGIAGGTVTNPLSEYLNDNEFGVPLVASYHYPDADGDGLPDGPYVLTVVQQPTGATNAEGKNIEELSNLPGVLMLPPIDLTTSYSTVSKNTRLLLEAALSSRGISLAELPEDATFKDVIYKVLNTIQPAAASFGAHIEAAAQEFADG
jgi:hypothetical protein